MKYYMVIAKCGHVGKNNYYRGALYIKADSGKSAARIARDTPRVKHDRKDAILSVQEIDYMTFINGNALNHELHYFSCDNRQEQNTYLYEIEDNIFEEGEPDDMKKSYTKKHSLNRVYNSDPAYDMYKKYNRLMYNDYIA